MIIIIKAFGAIVKCYVVRRTKYSSGYALPISAKMRRDSPRISAFQKILAHFPPAVYLYLGRSAHAGELQQFFARSDCNAVSCMVW